MSDTPVQSGNSTVSLETIVGAVTSAVRNSLGGSQSSRTTFERASNHTRGRSGSTSDSTGPSSAECAPKRPKFTPPTLMRSRRRGAKHETAKIITYMRDTILLPAEYLNRNGDILIPRSTNRTKLGKAGLVGKIEINSTMSDTDVRKEICQVFARPMGCTSEDIKNGQLFSFSYLQKTGEGSKALCVPSVKEGFEWNGKRVASLAKAGSIIYLLARDKLPVWEQKEVIEVLSEDEGEVC